MYLHESKSEQWSQLILELRSLQHETEWVEFKENKADPEEIGEYISALANSAALIGKTKAYLVWGIRNEDHSLVGTRFRPAETKVGNEELENWLLRLLTPKLNFRFVPHLVNGLTLIVLEIECAIRQPVSFRNIEHVRIGSYKQKLKSYPEKERQLWRIFDRVPFESGIAAEDLKGSDVLQILDTQAYFELLQRPIAARQNESLLILQADGVIASNGSASWDITNLGAILFARHLSDFPSLKRKAVRVIQYPGSSRVSTLREQEGGRGYASGFEGLISFITNLLPANEVVRQALRSELPAYPELAVRELVANALIHQDFSLVGTGPMVELFSDRIEITNPGNPLIEVDRFFDFPPRSRNETLASLMRRARICEERGSGWDKVVFETEVHQLPAPLAETTDTSTKVVLFGHQPLIRMDKNDRIRAVYLHACLRFVNREQMTNATLRERFGIAAQNAATASRLIREAVDDGMIVPYDPVAAPKLMRYVPFWAAKELDENVRPKRRANVDRM